MNTKNFAKYFGVLAMFGLLVACNNHNTPVPSATAITAQPTDQSVVAGTTATFDVVASNATGYQWQRSTDNGTTFTDIGGATAASHTTAVTTLADSGTQYRVVVSGASNSVTSSVVTLTVTSVIVAPSISMHPANQSIIAGQNASFTVTAGGSSLSYRWQRSTNSGANFTDVAGGTNATLMLTAVPQTDNAHQFRVVVSNSAGSEISNAALLTVNSAQSVPAFSSQPVNQSVVAPDTATFNVVATGTPSPTLQWQLSTNAGSSFVDIAGATASSYTTAATGASDNGNQYRVIATNTAGSAASNAAALTVTTPSAPSFTTHPVNVTITAGQNAQFTVAVSGTPTPTLQWQLSTDNGGNWSNITGETGTVFNVTGAALSNNGRQFRAVASNSAGAVNSNAAILTVNAASTVTVSTLVSATPAGVPPNNRSTRPSISADGNLVAFSSDATNIVSGTAVFGHAYLRNLSTGVTTLINRSLAGTESSRGVLGLKLSAGGRYAVFESNANDLAVGDTDNAFDVFLRDLQTGTTTRLTVRPDGSQVIDPFSATGAMHDVSADGRWVLMSSPFTLDDGGVYDGISRLFLRDTQAGLTRQVPTTADGFGGAIITPDGRQVMWLSASGSGATAMNNIHYYDIVTRLSGIFFSASADPFPNGIGQLSVSNDGRFVAFVLRSPTLLGGAASSNLQVVVLDRNEIDPSLALTLVSTGDFGVGDGSSFEPVLSGDGRYVLFGTNAPNLTGDPGATTRAYVMVRDRIAGTTQVASRRVNGSNVWVGGVNGTQGHALSADGAVLAFVPDVANMGLPTTLGEYQVFAAPRP